MCAKEFWIYVSVYAHELYCWCLDRGCYLLSHCLNEHGQYFMQEQKKTILESSVWMCVGVCLYMGKNNNTCPTFSLKKPICLQKSRFNEVCYFFSSLFHSVPCNSVRIVRPYEVKSMCIVGEFIFYMGMETFFSTCLWNSYHLYFIARMKTQCVFFSSILLAHFISHSDTEAFCSFPSFSVYTVHIHHTSVNIWTNFFVENFFFTVYYPVSHEKLMKRHSFAFSFSFSFYCSICILPLMKDNQKSIHRLSWRAQNCWALSHIDRLRLWLLFTLAKQMCA